MKHSVPHFFMIFKSWYIYVFMLFILSCTRYPSDVEWALKLAGDNRAELEKVLEYYRQHPEDSLKFRAAIFLISNMPGKYSEDDKDAKEYTLLFDQWQKMYGEGIPNKAKTLDSLVSVYQLQSAKKKLYDVNHIKADYLINNIERSFEVWQAQPWGKDIAFDVFCEEILPYRLETETLENWREVVLSQYHHLYDSLQKTDIDAVSACAKLLESMDITWYTGDGLAKATLPEMTYSMMNHFRTGSCAESVKMTAFTMRAFGIPVTRDFTPQWPFRSQGHDWNTIMDKDGNRLQFGFTENKPGEPHKPNHRMAKAFRKSFQNNFKLFDRKTKEEQISPLFKHPCIEDVSSEIFPAIDVSIELNHKLKKGDIVYLNVFNNQNWVPIHFSKTSRPAVFSSMGKNIVYLPSYFDEYRRTVACNYPFILTQAGDINWLIPDTSKYQTLTLLRKHPLLLLQKNHMKGGKFQGSNLPDFSDAVTLYSIPENPELYFQEVFLEQSGKYRYYRYLAPENGSCDIAELEFYGGSNGETRMVGEIAGTPGSWNNDPTQTFDKAFDGDILSFFDSGKVNEPTWTGMDFGKRTEITKIRYMPRNDDNTIAVDQIYELFYWGEKGWISLGKQTATEQVLYYRNAPTNALFLLRNLSKGKEERIFTYENGKQVWW